MQGNTHQMTGIACAIGAAEILTLGHVNTTQLIIAGAIGGFGSLLPDLDISKSKMSHNASIVISKCIIILALMLGSDMFLHTHILNKFQFNLIGIQSIALLAFVGMCIYGKFTKHRTFLHSITFGLLSALCVFMILPIAAPYYIVGFASHIVLDLLNHKKVQLLYPTKIGQFCFNIASSDGTVNYTICAVASVIALLEIYFILR